MPFMQRTYEEIKTNNTVCFTYYQWGSWVAATTVSQTDLTINRSHHNTWFPLIDFIDVKLAFFSHKPRPPTGRWSTADIWTQINRFSCNVDILLCSFLSIYILIYIFLPTLKALYLFFQSTFALCVDTGLVSFSGNTKQSLHPPLSKEKKHQQKSCSFLHSLRISSSE